MKSDSKPEKTSATILDVARLANVSKSAVSRHINRQEGVSGKAGDRIEKAIDELNYKPNTVARALKAKATKSIGLIIPSIENPVFPPLVKAIEQAAGEHGFTTILCISDGSVAREADYLELLVEKQADGVIFNAMGQYDRRFEAVKSANMQVIIIGKKIDGFRTANVTAGNFKGAFMAVEYLIASGMRHIAFLSGQMESSTAMSDRFDGYRAALGLYGLEYSEELVIREVRSFAGGIDAAEALLKRKREFDSIFVSNDIMAIGCMERLMDCGYSIPGDISVIGYDDIPSSQIIKPRLSTVLNSAEELGAGAVHELLRIIDAGRDDCRETEFSPRLVIRDSTRKIAP